MAAAIWVRTDYSSADLRRFARRCGDADQVRRLLAVALILDGESRSEAAKVAGVTLQIVRDWVLRFNKGGPDGLATRTAPGRASILNDEQRARLAEVVETGPIPATHGVVPLRQAQEAACRSGAVDMGRVPSFGHTPHAGTRAPRDGLSQALGSAAPPWPEARRYCRF
jgi:Winged helix-turn helix